MVDGRRWRWVGELAGRFLWGGRSRLLVGTIRAALLSTALGVIAMTVAMALMSGYTEEVRGKLVENGAIVVYPQLFGGLDEDALGPGDPRPGELAALPGVRSVTRAVYAQGSLSKLGDPEGVDVVLRGIEPLPEHTASRPLQADSAELEERQGLPGVVLGRTLARRLGVGSEDSLKLVVVSLEPTGPRFRYLGVRVSGTFETGFSEFDRSHVVIDSEVLERLAAPTVLYEVLTDDLDAVDRVYEQARERLGPNWVVTDWRRQNPGLFTALRLQKWALFLILGLIVVVSTFNVASTLVVLVREKTRDVGVLAALGVRPRQLQGVFVLCGLFLGSVGTGLGLAIGAAIAWTLTTFRLIRFDSEVAAIYFIDAVPFDVRGVDVAAVAAFALLVTLLASWLPARRASRIEPAAALRYE